MAVKVNTKYNRIYGFEASKREAIAQEVARAAQAIEAQAKSAAPVDTGNLRNSIQAEPKTVTSKYTWRVFVGAEYAKYVEYGTVRMAARPYFTPAVEKIRPEFIENLKQLIKNAT